MKDDAGTELIYCRAQGSVKTQYMHGLKKGNDDKTTKQSAQSGAAETSRCFI